MTFQDNTRNFALEKSIQATLKDVGFGNIMRIERDFETAVRRNDTRKVCKLRYTLDFLWGEVYKGSK